MNKNVWFALAGLLTLFTAAALAGGTPAGIRLAASADIDGDGDMEELRHVVGVPGECVISGYYCPTEYFGAPFTARGWGGIYGLRQTVTLDGAVVLDTGLPTLVGGQLVYAGAMYNSMQVAVTGNRCLTTWESDQAVLKRTADLTADRLLSRYQVFRKTGAGIGQPAAEMLFITTWWNNGLSPSIDASLAYVQARQGYYRDIYADSGLVPPGGQNGLRLSYRVNDFIGWADSYSVVGWDGWNSGRPDTKAIYGFVHLPAPYALEGHGSSIPCEDSVVAVWRFGDQATILAALVEIKPEVINLRSNGIFTAFVTLPQPYNVNDIVASSVVCSGAPARDGFVNDKGLFVAKFNRSDLPPLPEGPAVLTVQGSLVDGTTFSGVDTVRIINPNNKAVDRVKLALSVTPNPFRDGTVIRVEAGPELSTAAATIKIYNIMGQLIITLEGSPSRSGEATFSWDGNDRSGRKVSPGVYLYQLEGASERAAGRLLHIQ